MKIIKVKSCHTCPVDPGTGWCRLKQRFRHEYEYLPKDFPEWCPLPDASQPNAQPDRDKLGAKTK